MGELKKLFKNMNQLVHCKSTQSRLMAPAGQSIANTIQIHSKHVATLHINLSSSVCCCANVRRKWAADLRSNSL